MDSASVYISSAESSFRVPVGDVGARVGDDEELPRAELVVETAPNLEELSAALAEACAERDQLRARLAELEP